MSQDGPTSAAPSLVEHAGSASVPAANEPSFPSSLGPAPQLNVPRTPTRLVVCVDGTWSGPDGVHPTSSRNISNIFRIWCSIATGLVTDGSTGKRWDQQRVYIKGLGLAGGLSDWTASGRFLLAGAFGSGAEQQIKDVYRLCCERACGDGDEVWFFGFSRGAFVVRAVANLLSFMGLAWTPASSHDSSRVTNDNDPFEHAYARLLELYKDVRSGGERQRGAIYEYMLTRRLAPHVRFIGVLDTVKAFDDDGLYAIGLHPSHGHCRHALAINEARATFRPETWIDGKATQQETAPRKQDHPSTTLEAWFLGYHGDLGGAQTQDGVALYPVQWILSEARDLGLLLHFTEVRYTSAILLNDMLISNPLEIVFPQVSGEAHSLTLANGISTRLWDMRAIHEQDGYRLQLRARTDSWLFSQEPRDIFAEDSLIGYCESTSFGRFIHPSAYVVLEQDPSLRRIMERWPSFNSFQGFRARILENDLPLSKAHGLIPPELDDVKLRILLCGDAGVGKSTLVNLLLGVPEMTSESRTAHGLHDIEFGFSPDGAKYVLHDSCGFQTGQQDEIEKVTKFLRERSTSADFAERLHAILYCVSSTRLRTIEAADERFIETLHDCGDEVPVVVIATRLDELQALMGDEVERGYMREHQKKARRELHATDWDEIEAKTTFAVEGRKQLIKDDLTKLWETFHGPVFTSKDDPTTITAVVDTITSSLPTPALRRIFLAAQTCALDPKISAAITQSLELYTHTVRTAALPIAFSGLAAAATLTPLIVRNILKSFNLDVLNRDMVDQLVSTALVKNYESNGIYIAANVLNAMASGAVATGIGTVPGVAVGVAGYGLKLGAVPQFGRLVLLCTVDTVLIMERAFWKSRARAMHATIAEEDVKAASIAYRDEAMDAVHAEVKTLVPVWNVWNAFRAEKLEAEVKLSIERFRVKHDE